MPETVSFTRSPTALLAKGAYHRELRETSWTAVIRCPVCAHRFSLIGHAIDEAGVVSPAFVCACGTEMNIRLEGWP